MNFLAFSGRAKSILHDALNVAASYRSRHLGVEHLLLALSADNAAGAVTIYDNLSSACLRIRELVSHSMAHGDGDGSRSIPQTPAAKQSLILAMEMANSLGHQVVNPEHLLLALLELKSEPIVALLHSNDEIDLNDLRRDLVAASNLDDR